MLELQDFTLVLGSETTSDNVSFFQSCQIVQNQCVAYKYVMCSRKI
jgi:hypothetical protein